MFRRCTLLLLLFALALSVSGMEDCGGACLGDTGASHCPPAACGYCGTQAIVESSFGRETVVRAEPARLVTMTPSAYVAWSGGDIEHPPRIGTL